MTELKRIASSNPKPIAFYSEAIEAGGLLFPAGHLASDFRTGVAPEARRHPAFPFYGSDIKLQTRYVLQCLQRTFEAAGMSLDRTVKAQVFLTDLNDFAGFDEVWREFFDSPPPRTTIGTSGLLVRDTLVEIDLIGAASSAGAIEEPTSANPKPLANYSEARRIGDFVFAAGQLASDFKQGLAQEASMDPAFPYYGSAIKRQTRFVLENLRRTFAAAGTSLEHVVKAQVFLTDLKYFAAFDEVWKEFFPVPPPRTTVGTTGLLIRDTLVEIDLIAYAPKVGGKAQVIPPSGNPKPLANYSEAVVAGGLVFAAGQLATDFQTGVPEQARKHPAFPFYGSDIKLQTRYILENFKRTFAAAGTSLEKVVKAQVFLTDLGDFHAFDEVWREYFPLPPPRTTIETTGLLIRDSLIEIDLIAAV